MHEIITLQLGHQANYVGTHFWNTQESYFTDEENQESSPIDHNINFRSGVGVGGVETFTPRALIYDLKGGFGTLRKINALYQVENQEANEKSKSTSLWDHRITTQRAEIIEAIQYQKDLETGVFPRAPLTTDSVRYWSDYNRVYYHPRSSVQITEHELNSGIQQFEGYELGRDLFKELNREHDLLDRDLRPFVEECDHLQGIQLITSSDDAWSGFAAGYLADIRDEYEKIGIITWGLERGERVNKDKQLGRIVTLAKTLTNIASLASIYVPLRIPPTTLPGYLKVDRSSLWHNSALVSTAIETSSIPTRFHIVGGLKTIDGLAGFLNMGSGQNIAMLSMSIGDDVGKGKKKMSSERVNCSWGRDSKDRKAEHFFAVSNVSRGFGSDENEDGADRPDQSTTDRHAIVFDRLTTAMPFPMLDSFPSIFPLFTQGDSNRDKNYDKYNDPASSFVAVDTTLSTAALAVKGNVRNIRDVVAQRRGGAASAVGTEEKEVLIDELDNIVANYHYRYESDDDSDDY